MTAGLLSSVGRSPTRIVSIETNNIRRTKSHLQIRSIEYPPLPLHYRTPFPFLSFSVALTLRKKSFSVVACLSSSPSPRSSNSSTRLYISGLSFRTTEDSLRNAFKSFGQLLEVNLVMDKIANRPRGFAFLRYATEDESQKAIHGMHGKGDLRGNSETQIRASTKPSRKFRAILEDFNHYSPQD